MNRWLRALGATLLLMSANSAVFAVCEAELEETIQNRVGICNFIKNEKDPKRFCDVNNQRTNSNNAYKANVITDAEKGEKYLQLDISNAEEKIQKVENSLKGTPTCPGLIASKTECRLRAESELADAKLEICRIKYGSGRLMNSAGTATNSNANNQSQQTQQTQQTQSAQQLSQQTQQTANQNQARADQARQGKRKTHDPAAEAHQCISIDNAGSGNFGAFKNTCGYRVNFYTCNYKPRITQGGFNWSADFDCEKQQIGMHTPGAGVSVASHNRNTEMVYWFACKAPASPVDVTYVQGQGLSGRCN